MLYSATIDLVAFHDEDDDQGFSREVDDGTSTVFADVQSVYQSEFYAAAAQGISVVQMFVVFAADYHGERKVVYNGKTYYVVRTYNKGIDRLQLMCSDNKLSIVLRKW